MRQSGLPGCGYIKGSVADQADGMVWPEGFGIKATCTVFVCVYIDDCIVRKTETEQTVCLRVCVSILMNECKYSVHIKANICEFLS